MCSIFSGFKSPVTLYKEQTKRILERVASCCHLLGGALNGLDYGTQCALIKLYLSLSAQKYGKRTTHNAPHLVACRAERAKRAKQRQREWLVRLYHSQAVQEALGTGKLDPGCKLEDALTYGTEDDPEGPEQVTCRKLSCLTFGTGDDLEGPEQVTCRSADESSAEDNLEGPEQVTCMKLC